MKGQLHATMVASASLCLTLTPMLGIFEGVSWTIPVLLAVAVVATAGSMIRAAGRGQGLQTLGMVTALILLMTAAFNNGTAFMVFIPTPATFGHWLDLVSGGINDIIVLTPPVAAEGGILFLTMLGVGTVAILHDMFVVGLRTPALSGLTLLTMYLVPVSVAPDATAWFWFVLPALAYLWILADDNLERVSRFGHRFTGTGRLVGPRFPSPLAATARVSAAVFVTITLVLLTVVPTNTSGLVDKVAQGYGDGDGPGGDGIGAVDPWSQLSGQLKRGDPVVVARVTTDDPSPGYLRMHVADSLDRYRGFGPSEWDDLDPLATLEHTDGDIYTAELENVGLYDEVAPVFGRPTRVDLDNRWGVVPDTGVIATRGVGLRDVDFYSFEFTDPEWHQDTLARAEPLDADDPLRERYTERPHIPELAEIVDEVLADAETDIEKVRAILKYLSPSNGFSYSEETASRGNEEAILDFLDSQRGFCQQYASTMAWMLRVADVPARVAIGLTTGTFEDGEWVIDSHNYHAWVEVYFQGAGWVAFDPTPAGGVSGSVDFPWANEPGEGDDPADRPGAEPTDSAGGTAEPSAGPTDPGQNPLEELDGGAAAGETDSGGFNLAWVALGVLAVLPFLPLLGRIGLRRSRLRPKRLSAQSAWDETLDLALDYEVELDDWLTPGQAARVMSEAVPDAGEAAEALASAVAYDRYSGRDADASMLPTAVADLRTALDKAARPGRRFRARFWPASLAVMLAAKRGRAATRVAELRSKVRWPRRSNARRDATVTGRL